MGRVPKRQTRRAIRIGDLQREARTIRRLHAADILVTVAAAAFVWATLAFTVLEALPIALTAALRAALLAAAAAVGTLATAALGAVLIHLERHRDELYAEDLRHRRSEAPPSERPRREGGDSL